MLWVLQPVWTVSDERPSPHLSDAVGEGVDIAIRPVRGREVAGKPVCRNSPFLHEEAIELADEIRMGLRRNFSIIRHLADLPEPLDRILGACEGLDVVI